MDYKRIYAERATEYDRLVAAEDCDGNLIRALRERIPLADKHLLEVGVGTGRVTRMLAAEGAHVVGFDSAPAMLEVARRHVEEGRLDARLGLADAARLPVPPAWADGAVAGWVFGHFRYWMPGGWRESVGQAIAELQRACKPGAPIVIIETLGTGSVEAGPPSPELAEYYEWLEQDQRFSRATICTDYSFSTADEAAEVLGSFFGDELAARVRGAGWTRVPEHTGIWSRQAAGPAV